MRSRRRVAPRSPTRAMGRARGSRPGAARRRCRPRVRGRGTIGASPYLVLDWCAGSPNVAAPRNTVRFPRVKRRVALVGLADRHARHVRPAPRTRRRPRRRPPAKHPGRPRRPGFRCSTSHSRDGSATGNRRAARRGASITSRSSRVRCLTVSRRRHACEGRRAVRRLAALLYLLFTGEHYQDFQLRQRAFLTAICEGSVQSFAARGSGAVAGGRGMSGGSVEQDGWRPVSAVAAFAGASGRSTRERETPSRGGPASPRPADTPLYDGDSQRMMIGASLTRAGYGHRELTPPPCRTTERVGDAWRGRPRVRALPARARPRRRGDARTRGPVGARAMAAADAPGRVRRRGPRVHRRRPQRQHAVSCDRGGKLRSRADRQRGRRSSSAGQIRERVHRARRPFPRTV